MTTLTLSIMAQNPTTMGEIQKLLAVFETKTKIKVNLSSLQWSTAWPAISRYAASGGGPDVSEIGSTWMGDLIDKKALLAISAEEIKFLGGAQNFFTRLWQTCSPIGSNEVLAVPWVSGTRVFYYRKDRFVKAGINSATAFDTPQSLADALVKLQSQQGIVPWAGTARKSISTIHVTCSWIWAAGGDYFSPDGKRMWLSKNESINGLVEYFNLKKYMGSGPRMSDLIANTTFWGGQAGVTIDGHWLLADQIKNGNLLLTKDVAIAPVLGKPFVGGSNLIIWKTCKEPKAALELINFLNSAEVALAYQRFAGLLPARRDIFRQLIAKNPDPSLSVFEQSIQNGHSFPVIKNWGKVENKLIEVIGQIWDTLYAQPAIDVRRLVTEQIFAMEKQLADEGLISPA